MTGNTLHPNPIDTDRAALAAEYARWSIWQSDAGHWYATRRTTLPKEVRGRGLWETVDAADLRGLREELAAQTELLHARAGELGLTLDGGNVR